MGKIKLIVAFDDIGTIGYQGKIPWSLPDDLAWFKAQTIGHVVIMGKSTWYSLPVKPLPGRENIVLTHSYKYVSSGIWHLSSLDGAVSFARDKWPDKTIFIIGGASVYHQAMERNMVDEVLATVVHGVHTGDKFFNTGFQYTLDWKQEMIHLGDNYDRYKFTRCP
jgi:dihydrofolate reductase